MSTNKHSIKNKTKKQLHLSYCICSILSSYLSSYIMSTIYPAKKRFVYDKVYPLPTYHIIPFWARKGNKKSVLNQFVQLRNHWKKKGHHTREDAVVTMLASLTYISVVFPSLPFIKVHCDNMWSCPFLDEGNNMIHTTGIAQFPTVTQSYMTLPMIS